MQQPSFANSLAAATAALAGTAACRIEGCVTGASGLTADLAGLSGMLSVGDRISLAARGGSAVEAEVVGFNGPNARAMTFGRLDGVAPGRPATLRAAGGLRITNDWLGRVIDPLGRPLDDRGPLPRGEQPRNVRSGPPDAMLRARLGAPLETGVRVLDLFTTCRQGQRLGLFAGSGVGKSTLLSMLARQTSCDVVVLALVGERGREVREFIEDDLGQEGLARTVVVVATSDTPPLMRREAAHSALTVAEFFRDQGLSVLLLMDSVTRFCLALREIGLSAGEPPATRGYPPSVFAELPRLLERAGPGPRRQAGPAGTITGLFTVLVEGDDHNEPVADAVRGILDGHVVLDRRVSEAGRYPAVDVLRSLSRAASSCLDTAQQGLLARARGILALHADMADLVRLGAYRPGSDPAVDEAIAVAPRLEALLAQKRDDRTPMANSFALLAEVISNDAG